MASLDVVARNLRDRFGARYVSFLFVDVLGQRVVRVREEATSRQGRRASQMSLAGSVYDEVLRTQKLVQALGGEHGQRVVAPVTNRGDTIGMRELFLAEVITTATLTHQANIPHHDGQLAFPLLLKEGGQFSDEVREDVANAGMVLLHAARVAGAANYHCERPSTPAGHRLMGARCARNRTSD